MRASKRSPDDPYFDASLAAAAPAAFVEAVRTAVMRRGGTLSDFVRTAVSNELVRRGVHHEPPPNLRRLTFLHRHGEDAF